MPPRIFCSTLIGFALALAPAAAGPEKAGGTEPVPRRTEFEWYGYLKLDASWDSSLIDPGDFARWVASRSIVEDHEHFNMTARQTRLGVKISKPAERGLELFGRIELDFYGGGAENKNQPQLRQAYVELALPRKGLTLIAGQTNDLISPLALATINYSVAWWAGNIGYRRPQFRVTRRFDSGKDAATLLSAAISRTIGDDFGSIEPGDSGADAGVPTVQLAASHSWKLARERHAGVGVSGHWGREKIEEQLTDPGREFDSWSADLDFSFPLGSNVQLEGEIWTGENLDDYLGGIGQGIDRTLDAEIAASGGWLSLRGEMAPSWVTGAGIGLDDPDDSDLSTGARARNFTAWVNVTRRIRTDLDVGFEVSWWETDYRHVQDDSSYRVQSAVTYRF